MFIRSAALLSAPVALVMLVTGCASKSSKFASSAGTSIVNASAASGSPVGQATTTFDGVTVVNALDLTTEPKVTSTSTDTPTKLAVKDLVVGSGGAATATSDVTVQYVGVRFKDGVVFDSSWSTGKAVPFSLTAVITGFTQGIGGDSASSIEPMKAGGRRIMILPSDLAYGSQGAGSSIAPNTPLVFVVDLLKVS